MIVDLLVFILILSVLVFVHELGHFAVAKWTGMRVDEFGIGFPPRLWKRQRGDTLYSINAIPLGGYVKIHGENPEEIDDDPGSFQKKSVGARIAVIVAGVSMNLLFAFLVLTMAFSVGFISVSQNLENIPGSVVTKSQTMVVETLPGSPAAQAHLQPGDLIKTITDSSGAVTSITSLDSLQNYTKNHQASGNRAITITLDRNGTVVQQPVTLSATGTPLGIGIDSFNAVRVPVWRAPGVAVHEIGFIMGSTWEALKGFASQLFEHAHLDEAVSGPVGIYRATSSATQQGAMSVIFLMVALSVNLALLNILPIPALDGGKLVFLVIELIFRRRVIAEKVENTIATLGIAFLLLLVVLVTIKDISRL